MGRPDDENRCCRSNATDRLARQAVVLRQDKGSADTISSEPLSIGSSRPENRGGPNHYLAQATAHYSYAIGCRLTIMVRFSLRLGILAICVTMTSCASAPPVDQNTLNGQRQHTFAAIPSKTQRPSTAVTPNPAGHRDNPTSRSLMAPPRPVNPTVIMPSVKASISGAGPSPTDASPTPAAQPQDIPGIPDWHAYGDMQSTSVQPTTETTGAW